MTFGPAPSRIFPAAVLSLTRAILRPATGSQRAARPHVSGTPRLLLYDLRSDPFTLKNVNDLYPELVDKYTQLLEAQWDAHQVLLADLPRRSGTGRSR